MSILILWVAKRIRELPRDGLFSGVENVGHFFFHCGLEWDSCRRCGGCSRISAMASWGCGGCPRVDSVGCCIKTIRRWSRRIWCWYRWLWIWRTIERRISISRTRWALTHVWGLGIYLLRIVWIIAVLLLLHSEGYHIRISGSGDLSQVEQSTHTHVSSEASLFFVLHNQMSSTFFTWLRSPAAREYFFSKQTYPTYLSF